MSRHDGYIYTEDGLLQSDMRDWNWEQLARAGLARRPEQSLTEPGPTSRLARVAPWLLLALVIVVTVVVAAFQATSR